MAAAQLNGHGSLTAAKVPFHGGGSGSVTDLTSATLNSQNSNELLVGGSPLERQRLARHSELAPAVTQVV